MAKFSRPIEFTKVFKVDPVAMSHLGALIPALNVDTKLFIDPVLLEHSKHRIINKTASRLFHDYFADIIKLLQASKRVGDVAWKEAEKRFTIKEIPSTGLGYGAKTTHGSAIGNDLAARLTLTSSQIVEMGIEDPDLFKLLPLLEDDMGPDRISDMTTKAIYPALAAFTQDIVNILAIESEIFTINDSDFHLPAHPLEKKRSPIILVPYDILKRLPVASNWSEVADAAAKNAALRSRISRMIGNIWEKEVRADRDRLRVASLSSRESIECLIDVAKSGNVYPYHIGSDQDGLLIWRSVRDTVASDYPMEIKPGPPSPERAIEIVNQIIIQFRKLVENKGLWKLLWVDDKPRSESAAQHLFYAVADSYCEANNLDVTPEADTGNGPVDFKFSAGYNLRILVEAKLSKSSQFVHGYTKQLQIYADAEEPIHCVYLVIDVGSMGKKLERIISMKNAVNKDGKQSSAIELVDGLRKDPASKRH